MNCEEVKSPFARRFDYNHITTIKMVFIIIIDN